MFHIVLPRIIRLDQQFAFAFSAIDFQHIPWEAMGCGKVQNTILGHRLVS